MQVPSVMMALVNPSKSAISYFIYMFVICFYFTLKGKSLIESVGLVPQEPTDLLISDSVINECIASDSDSDSGGRVSETPGAFTVFCYYRVTLGGHKSRELVSRACHAGNCDLHP